MGEGEAGAGREEESEVCLEATPEPDGVRMSAAAWLNIWEGEDGGGGSVMCICIGVLRPHPTSNSAADSVDVGGPASGSQSSVTENAALSMVGGEFAVGVIDNEAGVGVRGVMAVVELISYKRVSTVGGRLFTSFALPLLCITSSFHVAGASGSSVPPGALALFFRRTSRPEVCLFAYSCAPGMGGGTKELEGLGKGDEAAGVSTVRERGGGTSVDITYTKLTPVGIV